MFGRNGKKPPEDSTSLGCILVAMGLVSEAELKAALRVQEHERDRRLGDLLMARGVLTADRLEAALVRQKELRHERVDYKAATANVLENMRRQVQQTTQAITDMSAHMQAKTR